ncbi:phosphatidate cytidylyltransferase [Asticcacaulis endophyticus]|jgi:phosphatidate cytidylyltransferase|uniref:Phosphatidate cytidylyltransferase n=1 Tax=Asticcacaulis endophyticus TaxID=1395890 RepID=A0A918UVK7_9CAUL|nr:CDP-archaeol synthase [Asticcacaulis endophyticus]GGZ37322.1 phosphatidate cytidylyltransferase [Asticcacaulis endophyticus]
MSPPKSTGSSIRELSIRIASAIVLVPVVLYIVHLGDWAFLVLVSVGVALLSIEWGAMAAPKTPTRMAVAVCLPALAGIFAEALNKPYDPFHPLVSVALLLFGAACSAAYIRRLGGPWRDAAYGACYIGWPAFVLIWLRQTGNGFEWVLFAFLIAWTADSAAYLVGRAVGGPKLWRKYSPNKTWAGFAGGMMAGMLAAGTLSDLTGLFKSSTSAQIVGLLTALATMAGDLWESMLKRRYGVKDSGSLIPGHGGLLDRVDGLMFAIVAIGGIRLLVMLGTVL